MRVALVNTKGGTGKTTSAMMLAEAARRRGYSSAVLDADPQGSASEWAERAHAAGDPLPFEVDVANRATLERKAASSEAEWLLIDSAPGDPAVIEAAVNVADLTVIPTRSTPADMDRALETYGAVDGPAALLLWNISPRTQLYRQARDLIATEEIVALSAEIATREDVNKLWFTSLAYDLHGYEAVFDEIQEALATTTGRTQR